MAYFPLCINLEGTSVILVGEGNITRDKLNILLSFKANIQLFSLYGFEDMKEHPQICLHRRTVTQKDFNLPPTLVVVGDIAPDRNNYDEKKRISDMAQELQIPVNIVDTPELCTFYFPALITNGALTVSISTGGKSPSAAVYLKNKLAEQIPDQSGIILEWAQKLRIQLQATLPATIRRQLLKEAVAIAFEKNRPLSEDEISEIYKNSSFFQSFMI